jgi:alpha-L-arabinofuranosidase
MLAAACWLGSWCWVGACAAAQTTIVVGSQVERTGVERLGINLSGQTYYDSGQMLRNLVARNPGFEGERWQTILHCKRAGRTSCTDENQYAVWPAGFLKGAQVEVLSGAAAGERATVVSSTAAQAPLGVTLTLNGLTHALHDGDFVLACVDKPGGAEAGWWTEVQGGAVIGSERRDLSPHTPGKQALRVEAEGAGQSATVSSYFDTLAGHSFVQLRGMYRLRFRARPLSARRALEVRLQRMDTAHGMETLLDRSVELRPGWNDYELEFAARENGSAMGNVGLTFGFTAISALLDDVELTPASRAADNPTAFRDEVVEALRELHPGVLRYMDNGTSFGSSLDNLLRPQLARERAGASTQATVEEDVPIGLGDFLELCSAVGAEPWVTLPPGLSREEAKQLVEYLAGPVTTEFGARRAAEGQAKPWTEVFARIHLELGNEQWNAGSFAGATMNDPVAYGQRVAQVFGAMRGSAYFKRERFDLVMGSWFAVPWWTGQELAAASAAGSGVLAADTVAVAPYLFNEFNAADSVEEVFGPMLAEPEAMDARSEGMMQQQERVARSHGAALAVYETNLGTASGAASQAAIDATVPSLGAGLAVADHMLLMLRDVGVQTQCLFALPEYRNPFRSTKGATETMPLWGAVVDMGGATNLRRPSFLALAMINRALLATLVESHVAGVNPVWQQAPSANDKIALKDAHELETFAFRDGARRSLVVLNLSRTEARTVRFTGEAPRGKVRVTTLTAERITDSNEHGERVKPVTAVEERFDAGAGRRLAPFSLTVMEWTSR